MSDPVDQDLKLDQRSVHCSLTPKYVHKNEVALVSLDSFTWMTDLMSQNDKEYSMWTQIQVQIVTECGQEGFIHNHIEENRIGINQSQISHQGSYKAMVKPQHCSWIGKKSVALQDHQCKTL